MRGWLRSNPGTPSGHVLRKELKSKEWRNLQINWSFSWNLNTTPYQISTISLNRCNHDWYEVNIILFWTNELCEVYVTPFCILPKWGTLLIYRFTKWIYIPLEVSFCKGIPTLSDNAKSPWCSSSRGIQHSHVAQTSFRFDLHSTNVTDHRI
jgi:hypothetical protein